MPRSNSGSVVDTADLTLAQIAGLVGGEAVGDPHFRVSGACGIQEAGPTEITFLRESKYLPLLQKSKAGAVIVGRDSSYRDKPVIVTDNPAQAFLQVLSIWTSGKEDLAKTGIHPHASVAASAVLGQNVFIGAGAVVGERTQIGDGSSILPGAVIGDDCRIGRDTLIYENVSIRDRSRIDDRVVLHAGAVIGADGFATRTSAAGT